MKSKDLQKLTEGHELVIADWLVQRIDTYASQLSEERSVGFAIWTSVNGWVLMANTGFWVNDKETERTTSQLRISHLVSYRAAHCAPPRTSCLLPEDNAGQVAFKVPHPAAGVRRERSITTHSSGLNDC